MHVENIEYKNIDPWKSIKELVTSSSVELYTHILYAPQHQRLQDDMSPVRRRAGRHQQSGDESARVHSLGTSTGWDLQGEAVPAHYPLKSTRWDLARLDRYTLHASRYWW